LNRFETVLHRLRLLELLHFQHLVLLLQCSVLRMSFRQLGLSTLLCSDLLLHDKLLQDIPQILDLHQSFLVFYITVDGEGVRVNHQFVELLLE